VQFSTWSGTAAPQPADGIMPRTTKQGAGGGRALPAQERQMKAAMLTPKRSSRSAITTVKRSGIIGSAPGTLR
jgi:hypothetical protein